MKCVTMLRFQKQEDSLQEITPTHIFEEPTFDVGNELYATHQICRGRKTDNINKDFGQLEKFVHTQIVPSGSRLASNI